MTPQKLQEAIRLQNQIKEIQKEIESIEISIVIKSNSDIVNQEVKSAKFRNKLPGMKEAVMKESLSDALAKLIKMKKDREERFSKL